MGISTRCISGIRVAWYGAPELATVLAGGLKCLFARSVHEVAVVYERGVGIDMRRSRGDGKHAQHSAIGMCRVSYQLGPPHPQCRYQNRERNKTQKERHHTRHNEVAPE